MVPVLLVSLSDALCMKNVGHACSIEKYWCLVQVLIMADFYYFGREGNLYKTCIW
jgi:hypothetical protein